MTIIATCATIALALADAKGGEIIRLSGDCRDIRITRVYPRRVSVLASGATLRGLRITGGNILLSGGRVLALGPSMSSREGYGLHIDKASDVTVEGVTFGYARKAVVIGNGQRVSIVDSIFEGVREDGIIVAGTRGLTIARNRFRGGLPQPTSCTVGAATKLGVAKRDCKGIFVDGDHADAVQMRHGVTDALIEGNVIEGPTQGITQMDKVGDLPLERVRVRNNVVATSKQHPITLSVCTDCSVTGNAVRRAAGSTRKTVIIAPPGVACGNIVEDVQAGTQRCTEAR